jgi:hypothetical protein
MPKHDKFAKMAQDARKEAAIRRASKDHRAASKEVKAKERFAEMSEPLLNIARPALRDAQMGLETQNLTVELKDNLDESHGSLVPFLAFCVAAPGANTRDNEKIWFRLEIKEPEGRVKLTSAMAGRPAADLGLHFALESGLTEKRMGEIIEVAVKRYFGDPATLAL